MAAITVEAKVAGQRRPLISDWQVPLPPEAGLEGGATLRQLIAEVVRAEVRAFQERREERRLTHVLSPEQIASGAARGKIDMGGREVEEPDVDPQQAVETAILAFQDGLYYVFLDDAQVTELDRPLPLQTTSRLAFLRLVALAGG
jgi:hypothetical protein